MKLHTSQEESRLLGLKVARNEDIADVLDGSALRKMADSEGIELFRIKVDLRDANLFRELDAHHLCHEIFTINTQLSIDVRSEWNGFGIVPTGMSCTAVHADDPTFEREVAEILESKGWFEYHGRRFRSMVPVERSKELAQRYFGAFRLGLDGKRAWRLVQDGQTLGVFMGRIRSRGFHGTLYGILPEHRKTGRSRFIYQFMLDECRQAGWETFFIEVHLSNAPSLRSAVGAGLRMERSFFNLNIFPK